MRLQMTEARTESLRPTLHGRTIGSTKKTSRKEKQLVKGNGWGDSMVLSLGELVFSSSPKLESPSFPRSTSLVSRGLANEKKGRNTHLSETRLNQHGVVVD